MNQPIILDDNSWDGEERGRRRVQKGKECGRGGECTLSELTGTSSGIIEILSMLLTNFSL